MSITDRLTLEQCVGQLMICGFQGTEVNGDLRQLIEEWHIGGLLLFSRNIDTPEQTRRLTSELQSIARRAGHPASLLITIDQENGVVRRLGEGTTLYPGSMALGATGSAEAAYHVGFQTAKQLLALGINLNLVPVLDVNNNPRNPVIGSRSFGEDAAAVAELGIALMKGHQDAGVMTTVKHFPGHGDTHLDSHLALPTIPHAMDRLEQVELYPFRKAMEAGVDSVMVAHVVFPAMEPHEGIPATISVEVITKYLRERMGFDGVITSDCMEMSAIQEGWGTAEGAVRAVEAGIDAIMISHRGDLQRETMSAILKAVSDGRLSEERIRQSAERMLRLKQKYAPRSKPIDEWRAFVGSRAGEQFARDIYRRSVTLIRHEAEVLPLRLAPNEGLLVVTPGGRALTPVEDERYATYPLAEAIRKHHAHVVECSLDDPQLVELAQRSAAIVASTSDAVHEEEQCKAILKLQATGKPLVVVGLRGPYDLMAYPEVNAFLTVYEYNLPGLEALADVIFGQAEPWGSLPVSLPGVAARGQRLQLLRQPRT